MPGIDSFAKLMLHGNGSDASTTFTDDSLVPHTVTRSGNAQIDTAQSKFGGASILFDGTGDFLSSADSDDWAFGTGDFTIDFWVRFSNTTGDQVFFGQDNGSSNRFSFYKPSDGSLFAFWTVASVNIAVFNTTDTGLFTANQWYHIALVRNGANEFIFVDGVSKTLSYSVNPDETTNYPNYSALSLTIGSNFFGNYFKGWIDEFRWSKGIARWTANFTPPTEEYTQGEEASIAESITLDETVIASPSLIKQTVTETVQLSETINKSITKAVNEFINLTETIGSSQAITRALQENLQLSESVTKSLTKNIFESLTLTENIEISPSNINVIVAEEIQLTEEITATASGQEASNASKIIRYNPLIFVTNTTPAQIVEIDISDPENPVHSIFPLIGASSAKDVARNSVTGYIYVACADGIVVKVDESLLSSQTLIDLSDTDDLQTIEVLDAFGITYTTTDASTGELYMIDERTTVIGDFRLDVLAQQFQIMDSNFTVYQSFHMDADFTVLSLGQGLMNSDFKCLSAPVDDIVPIKETDFVVYLNNVQLEQFDVDLSSITITHTIDQESIATLRLNRRHDKLDYDLEDNLRAITSQNAVKITIQGTIEFNGFVSQIDAQYNQDSEYILITANMAQKTESYNNVTLSLPSLTSRLNLYNVMIQNPRIYNPILDVDAENPLRYNGVRVDLGEKRVQNYSRWLIFDSLGSIADEIEEGTFIPLQNWTYFWSPTVKKFQATQDFSNILTAEASAGLDFSQIKSPVFKFPTFTPFTNLALGDTAAVQFLYIGTSLSPVSEDLWVLTNAKHRRQRQYEDKITVLGTYTVGSAPFKDINTRNGIFIPKYYWSDESNGLYSIRESGYNFEAYAKAVADLEYQKILNINGQVLPETSCDLTLTVDGYYYHRLTLLTRINVDNTTQSGIYKNSNGFPVSIKTISINSSDRQVSISADNLKSNLELEALDGEYPDEDDDEYNDDEKRTLIALKSDMKTLLKVT